MSVFRIYVEKKPEFAVEAQSVLNDVQTALRLSISGIRILNRYDVDKLSQEDFEASINTVFSEPAVDVTYTELPEISGNQRVFAVEYLPGQFDQRADSCEQCIQILRQGERCRVKNARVYIVNGNITDSEFDKLKAYIINPVESREASLDTVRSLDTKYDIPTTVEELEGILCSMMQVLTLSLKSSDLQWTSMISNSVRIISETQKREILQLQKSE